MASSHDLEIHYLKGNEYRTDYVTGFYGGVTNQGKLHMSYYLERPPLPQAVKLSLEVDSNGVVVGQPVEHKIAGKDGIIREVQGGLIMDLVAAKSLSKWLNDKIQEFESLNPELKSKK